MTVLQTTGGSDLVQRQMPGEHPLHVLIVGERHVERRRPQGEPDGEQQQADDDGPALDGREPNERDGDGGADQRAAHAGQPGQHSGDRRWAALAGQWDDVDGGEPGVVARDGLDQRVR